MKAEPTYTCSICFQDFTGFGNNAYPINEGRCCNECNDMVIVARIRQMKRRSAKKENKKDEQ